MSYYGKWETYKVTYYLPPNLWSGGCIRGVALVEAGDPAHASQVFREQYSGQYSTIDRIERLFG